MNLVATLQTVLTERGAVLQGHFRLSSGRHSNLFVQKFRILEDPVLVELVAAQIVREFARAEPTVVVSAAVGGIILGYEVARQFRTKAIFVEKERGIPALRRDFVLHESDRAVVVEDVVTTGGSVREVLNVVRQRGAQVVGIGVIVQRSAVDFGVPTTTLLEIPMASYVAEQCPQCAAGVPLTDPGSRRS